MPPSDCLNPFDDEIVKPFQLIHSIFMQESIVIILQKPTLYQQGESIVTYLLKYRFIFFVNLLGALLYGHYYINKASVEIRIQSPGQTFFSVYWASTGEQSYSGENCLLSLQQAPIPGFFSVGLKRS